MPNRDTKLWVHFTDLMRDALNSSDAVVQVEDLPTSVSFSLNCTFD